MPPHLDKVISRCLDLLKVRVIGNAQDFERVLLL